MEYKKAPISEVVCGIFVPESVFSIDDISRLNVLFITEYPQSEILPPIFLEMYRKNPADGKFQTMHLVPANSTTAYLYRRFSKDNDYLIQFQENCFYLNWIRQDNQDVGNYPGFVNVYKMFTKELEKACSVKPIGISDGQVFELNYTDRVPLHYADGRIRKIEDCLNISLPAIIGQNSADKINLRYTIEEKELNGSGFLEVSTDCDQTGMELLEFRYIIRGEFSSKMFSSRDLWFSKAHDRQKEVFETSFKNSAKEEWK